MKLFALILFAALNVSAQDNVPAATNAAAAGATNPPPSAAQRAEQIRAECIHGRRIICGKILKVLPEGLVVDSGYTNLLRSPLDRSWIIPGSVAASRPAVMVESREPDSACVGVVFLTDLPKSRGVKPKQFDYVSLTGYPAGQYTYTSVGTVQKTVRQFSGNLLKAVKFNFESEETSAPGTK